MTKTTTAKRAKLGSTGAFAEAPETITKLRSQKVKETAQAEEVLSSQPYLLNQSGKRNMSILKMDTKNSFQDLMSYALNMLFKSQGMEEVAQYTPKWKGMKPK
jgi:hypothetical protein